VLDHARTRFDLSRIVAITSPDNVASGRLLEKLGLRFERLIRSAPDGEELRLFAISLRPGGSDDRN
jgi:RimJ/RimL family protein N-acetyltransferase